MSSRLLLMVGLSLAWVGCNSETPSPPGPSSELLAVPLPDASLLSPEQLESYRRQLASIEKIGEAPAADVATRFGDLGKRMFADGFKAAAEPCFRNAQTLDPERFAWTYYLAHVYAASGKTDRAIDRFEAALQQRPDDLAAWVSLGNAQLAAAHAEDAIEAYGEALERNPDSPSALAGLGRARLALDDYPAAVAALTKALELAPEASVIHYPLAQATRGLGQMDLAEQHLALRGDVEIYPFDPLMQEIRTAFGSPVVLNERGRAAFARGDFEAAIIVFRRVAETASDEPWVHANLAVALFHHGDRNAATQALRRARSLAPGDPDILYSLGAIEESEGHHDQAEDLYRAVLVADSEHTGAHLRLAHLMRGSGNYPEAVEHYSAALEVEPRMAVAHLGRAMSLVKLRRWAAALDALELATRALPDQPAFAHAWARILASAPDDGVRDGRRSLQILDELVKAGQDSTDIGETLAMALAETGEFQRAQQIQTQMLTLANRSADRTVLETMGDRLESYRQETPWREPWPDDHPLHRPPNDATPVPPRRAQRTQ
jgi:tetratricopeptide (TPR) repeat protein